MDSAAAPSPADRFTAIIDGLWKLMWARAFGFRLTQPQISRLLTRLRRMATRFRIVAERVQAGAVPVVAVARERRVRVAREAVAAPSDLLPRQFGWGLEVVALRWEVGGYSAQLEMFLEDPELVALVPVAPELGRVLRPLCRMLAVRQPAWLKLPKRKRKPRPKVVPEAHPEMWRWPHATFHARFGTKKHRAKLAAWEAWLEERKKREGGG